MDYQEKTHIINSVCAGGFFCEVSFAESVIPLYIDFNIDIKNKVRSDYLYRQAFNDAKKEGIHTKEEYINYCIDSGLWSVSKDKEVEEKAAEVKRLKKGYLAVFYNEKEKKSYRERIGKLIYEQATILSEKANLLSEKTAESIAEKHQLRCIYSWMVKDLAGNALNAELIASSAFIAKIQGEINNAAISQSDMRQVARSNPWRITWSSVGGDATSIFGGNAAEFTEEQVELCYWTDFYSGVFEAYEKPAHEIIEDDLALDSWYEAQIEKQATNKDSFEGSEKVKKHKEIFIKTDKKNAAKIYEKNEPHVRSAIKKRNNILLEEGTISESDLIKKQGVISGDLFTGKRN